MSSKDKKASQKKTDGDDKPANGTETTVVAPPPAFALGQAAPLIALILILGSSSYAFQGILSPLFGRTLVSAWHVLGSIIGICSANFLIPDTPTAHFRALHIALGSQLVALAGARALGTAAAARFANPQVAQLVVHTLLAYPTISFAGAVWLHWMRTYSEQEEVTRTGEIVVRAFSSIAVATFVWYLDNTIRALLSHIPAISPKAVLAAAAIATYALSAALRPHATATSSPRTHAFGRVLAVTTVIVALGAVSLPPYAPSSLHIIWSRHGGRGLVQVVDAHLPDAPPMRYLRRDAGIVGASVIAEGVGKDDVTVVGETLNSAAALLDAVRLVKSVIGKNALVLGVGTGATASSLIKHGYNTTLVEPHPDVLHAAQTYFSLPAPATADVEDPVYWVHVQAKRARAAEAAATAAEPDADPSKVPAGVQYDVVLHDVFEGGVLPAEAFTDEFWESLKKILDERGVVAVNYVGKPTSPTFRSVLGTLLEAFGTCRAFHDAPVGTNPLADAADKISNFAVFCTPTAPLKFRDAKYADYRGSPLRETILRSLSKREVSISAVLGDTPRERTLIKANDPTLGAWGKDAIADYWKLMRQQFPPFVWSSY